MSVFKQDKHKRSNPPCEDFAETRQHLELVEMQLEVAKAKIISLNNVNKRNQCTIDQLNDLIADILDDGEGEVHVT